MPEIVLHPNRAGDQNDPTTHLEIFRACCRKGSTDGWTCKKTAAAGDVYLFWFSKPVLKIAGVGICKGDVDPTDVQRHWMCSFCPLRELKHPITQERIKADRILAEWWKSRPFQGGPKRIPDEVAASLLQLILILNPSLDPLLREHLRIAPATSITISDDDDAPPSTVIYTTTRRVRNTAKGDRLKILYKCRCQVCGYCIILPRAGGAYAEVHHLRPLGGEHRGLDNLNNMLVLCPNCHAEFDALAMAINPQTGKITCFDGQNPKAGRELVFQGEHKLAAANINYHWRRFREA